MINTDINTDTYMINNIESLLQKNNLFNSEEIKDINTIIDDLFKEYIEKNILSMNNPDFDNNLTKYIYLNLSEQILHLYNNSTLYRAKSKLKRLISKKKFQFYSIVVPRRSQKISFIR